MTPLDLVCWIIAIALTVFVGSLTLAFIAGAVREFRKEFGFVDKKTLRKFKSDPNVN